MRTHEPFDEGDLHTLMEELPMSKHAPDELKNKLYDLAASPAPKRRAARRPIFAFAMGGAFVAVAVAVMTSLPADAKSWSGIKNAVQQVRTMAMTIRDFEEEEATVRVGFAPGTMLVQADSSIVYMSDKGVEIYDKEENTIQEIPVSVGKMMPDIGSMILTEVSMSKMLQQFEAEYGKQNIRIGSLRAMEGKRVYEALLNDPKDGENVRIVADADSDLPLLIESFKNGKRTTEITARYNGDVTKEMLEPNFPANAKREKMDFSKMFEEGKQGSPPPLHFNFD
jgi:hypothetical protein